MPSIDGSSGMEPDVKARERIKRVLELACSADRPLTPEIPVNGLNPMKDYWIARLHGAFLAEYREHPEQSGRPVEVFSAGRVNPEWRISEFGFDVLVVETDGSVPTPVHKAPMPVFARPLWQVESEMAVNSFEVGKDLGKLVVGAAGNKLLITRSRQDTAGFNQYLMKLARHASGNLFAAYIPSYSRQDRSSLLQYTTPGVIPVEAYDLSSATSIRIL